MLNSHITEIPDYNSVYRKYAGLIHNLASKYPAIYLEDLKQEGCIALQHALKSYSPQYSLKNWIRQHVSYAILHYMRDKSSAIRIPASAEGSALIVSSLDTASAYANDAEDLSLSTTIGTQSFEANSDAVLDLEIIRRHIHSLSVMEFQSLYLRYILNFTFEEIAQCLIVNSNAAQRLVKRALYKVKRYYASFH